jgi:hypothetical protein
VLIRRVECADTVPAAGLYEYGPATRPFTLGRKL